MRAADTNVLVRLIARDDSAQLAAAEAFVAKGAWVSHVVLAETIWVLDAVYELGAGALATAIEMLLDHEQVTIQEAEVVQEALREFRSNPKLGFSDCLVLAIAKKAGHVPLGTFDRRLSRLEGATCVGRAG
jgi:predicted nucleic-acid-binding protein